MFPQKPLDSTKVIPLVGSVFATESEIFGLLGSLSHDFLALTLESEIDVAPSPSEKFNLRILISIKAMWPFFNFFPSIFFSEIDKRTHRFILDSVPAKMRILCIAIKL